MIRYIGYGYINRSSYVKDYEVGRVLTLLSSQSEITSP